jgi:hypothetical protein
MFDLAKLATPQNAFYGAVAAFGVYNTSVIQWELNKPNSTECPKCAYTRIAIGLTLSAVAAWLLYQEISNAN